MQRPSFWTPDRILLLAVVAAMFIYWRDLSGDFLLDDVPLILMNSDLASWRSLPAIFHSDIFHLSDSHSGTGAIHYRPIYMTWLLLNSQLFGYVLPWWHMASMLLHAAVTLLVYRLGVKVLPDRGTPVLAASVFAVHPIHAETVAYLSASTDLLVALFLLVALLFYIDFRERGRRRDLAISVIAVAFAVLCKESAGVFPWMLVTYETFRRTDEDRGWRRYLWTLPYFAVGAAYVITRTLLFGFNAGPGPGISRWAASLHIPLAMLVYAKNLLVPIQLSFFYPPEWTSTWTLAKAGAVMILAMAIALIWIRHKSRPDVRMLLLWTGIMFIPAALALTTFVHDHWVHDRHMYAVTVPLSLLVAALLAESVRRPRALAAVGVITVLLLALETWLQVPRFQDEVSIYASAEKIAPRNANMHRYSASALWKYNRREQALEEYRTVVELRPNSPLAHYEYGGALAAVGRSAEALKEYQAALSFAPSSWTDKPDVLYRIALLEIASSNLQGAEPHIREAITLAPEMLNYHATLAQILAKKGDTIESGQELQIEAANRKRYLDSRRASGDR